MGRTRGLGERHLSDELVTAEYLVEEAPDEMDILDPNLDKDRTGLRQQLPRHLQAVSQVGEIRVNAELPSISIRTHLFGLPGEMTPRAASRHRADLFGLARRIFHLPVLHVALARRDLPVRPELDAVRRIEIDRLDLALEPFLLGEASHHEQRVAEDHPVRPLAGVAVELDLLREGKVRVRREEAELLLGLAALALRSELLNERQRVDRLADVDRDGRHLEVVGVLLVLALPDELRVERWIAGVAHDRGPLLFRAGERLELGGRDVRAGLRRMGRRPDDRLRAHLLSHGLPAGHPGERQSRLPSQTEARRARRSNRPGVPSRHSRNCR